MIDSLGMPALWVFLGLLGAHWVGDFVLQTHWQATNKSKRWDALAAHVATYTATLLASALVLMPLRMALGFVAVNGALHFATDAVSSRATSRLYARGDWHNFFVIIGADQLIHQATLAATLAVAIRV